MESTKLIEFVYGLEDGGAETLVKDYALLIDKKAFDLSVVVIRNSRSTANVRALQKGNIQVTPVFQHWNLFTKAVFLLFGRWYVPYRLRKIIRKEKPQALHVHMALLRYLPGIGRGLDGIRLFYTCHSIPSAYFGSKRRSDKKAAEYLIRHNKLQLIALHEDMAKELNAMFGVDNTVVIRNGIDFSRFRDLQLTSSDKRRALGIPQDAFVLGHVGRFMKPKNHPFLVEIFNAVAKRNKDAFLLMLGLGDTSYVESKLAEYGLADRYMILSNRSDVNEIMRTMDVFVFPSLYEGLPLVLVEALVSGLRCIASDTINKEAFLTEDTISLPLGSAEKWADVILDNTIKSDYHGCLDDYDMNKEILRLQKLYAGEWDE